MKAIWKYPLVITDQQEIRMPKGAEIISVQRQGEEICLWALVAAGQEIESRLILIFGTGHPIPDNLPGRFIGTVQHAGGRPVWHIFEG
jgi:hypothetical protein